MSAILLSNTRGNENELIFNEIKNLLKEESKIAYFPTSEDTQRKYFDEVKDFFARIGDYKLEYFGLYDSEWEEKYYDELINYDALYISGGNTFNLLHHIRKRRLENLIGIFFEKKLVIGTSAGGISMTKKINISECSNDFNLNNFDGLGLVDFYFYPHFEDNSELVNTIQTYKVEKLSTTDTVYGINDQSAIVVKDKLVKFIGECWKF